MNKYVLMRGYLLNNLEMTPDKLCEKLIEDNKALAFISSNEIKSQNDSSILIEEFIKDGNTLFEYDRNYLQEVSSSVMILLAPVPVYFDDNTSLDLNIFLRIYENNTMIVTIKIDTDYDVSFIFEKFNILSAFDIVSDLLYSYNITLSPAISRNFFIINKRTMSLENITKSLCQTSLDFKKYEPLKDFRGFDDYYHHTSELSSVIYGNNLENGYYRLLMLDHFIIYLILKDFNEYDKIMKDKYGLKYGLKKLYKMKETYDFSFVTKKYTKLIEDNNYVNYVLKTQNKYDLSKLCSYEIDRKIERKNNMRQMIFLILGFVLALPTLIEFLLKYFFS